MDTFDQGDGMLRFERLDQGEIVTHSGPSKTNVKYFFINFRHRRVSCSRTVVRVPSVGWNTYVTAKTYRLTECTRPIQVLRWEILSFQLQGSEGVDFSAFAKRTSGCRLKRPSFLRIVAMGPVSPLDLRLRPPDRPPALTTGGRRKNMSRESSKSMKIGLKFEWEIEPRERFAQNPPKFVSPQRAGLTFPKHCQAGAPNGHHCRRRGNRFRHVVVLALSIGHIHLHAAVPPRCYSPTGQRRA